MKGLLRAYILSSSRKWSIYHERNYKIGKINLKRRKEKMDHMVVGPFKWAHRIRKAHLSNGSKAKKKLRK